jgi:hypothetical protein
MQNGAPERIRTSDPQIRSLVLYPAELRARAVDAEGKTVKGMATGVGCVSGNVFAKARHP